MKYRNLRIVHKYNQNKNTHIGSQRHFRVVLEEPYEMINEKDGHKVPWIQPVSLREGEWIGDTETPWNLLDIREDWDSFATHYGSEIYWKAENEIRRMTNRELKDYIGEHRTDPTAQDFLKDLGGFDLESEKTRPILDMSKKVEGSCRWIDGLLKNRDGVMLANHRGHRLMFPEPYRNTKMTNLGLIRYLLDHKGDLRTRELLEFESMDEWRIQKIYQEMKEGID